MSKRLAVAFAIVVGLIAIATPIAISTYWAWRQSLSEQLAKVVLIADDILRRSDESTDQTFTIFNMLEAARAQDPCSPDNMRLMSKLDLASAQVQAIGYVENNRLI